MERFIEITKLVTISILVVVGLLCLSYSNAYGFTSWNFTLPDTQAQLTNSTTGTTGTTGENFISDERPLNYADEGDYSQPPDNNESPTVPEPATLILFGVGLLGMKLRRRKS